jgi:cell division protein ZapA (FtsZ GTPase activity inhibitor)
MKEARSVEVTIGGHKLRVSSELPEEYTREVAAYLDAALARIRAEVPTVDAHRAAILAGLAITDELFQARTVNSTTAHRLQTVMERLVRLLPPAKRGSLAQDAVAPGS